MRDDVIIGEIFLKENGYATSWFGKNHNTPTYFSTAPSAWLLPIHPRPLRARDSSKQYFQGFTGGQRLTNGRRIFIIYITPYFSMDW